MSPKESVRRRLELNFKIAKKSSEAEPTRSKKSQLALDKWDTYIKNWYRNCIQAFQCREHWRQMSFHFPSTNVTEANLEINCNYIPLNLKFVFPILLPSKAWSMSPLTLVVFSFTFV